jgi:hypothetical protein
MLSKTPKCYTEGFPESLVVFRAFANTYDDAIEEVEESYVEWQNRNKRYFKDARLFTGQIKANG